MQLAGYMCSFSKLGVCCLHDDCGDAMGEQLSHSQLVSTTMACYGNDVCSEATSNDNVKFQLSTTFYYGGFPTLTGECFVEQRCWLKRGRSVPTC